MRHTKKMGNLVLLTAAALLALSCGSENKEEKKKNTIADASNAQSPSVLPSSKTEKIKTPVPKKITKAVCVLNPKSGSEVVGAVTFAEEEGGVRIIADVAGLKPGKHGFHIHEHGDCGSPDASSAGGHFNPTHKKHGGPDSAERHVGDLGNLEANSQGLAHYDRVDSVISLNGPQSIIGKSIIVHADEDDLVSDPTGNAGKRIACGEIVESTIE